MAQRIVIVIAAGVALAAIGFYLTNRGSARPGLHFATSAIGLYTGPPRWLRLIIWLVLDGIWAVASIVVLRSPPEPYAQPVKGP